MGSQGGEEVSWAHRSKRRRLEIERRREGGLSSKEVRRRFELHRCRGGAFCSQEERSDLEPHGEERRSFRSSVSPPFRLRFACGASEGPLGLHDEAVLSGLAQLEQGGVMCDAATVGGRSCMHTLALVPNGSLAHLIANLRFDVLFFPRLTPKRRPCEAVEERLARCAAAPAWPQLLKP